MDPRVKPEDDDREVCMGEKTGPKMEKPAAGGGAAGFPIEPNGDWEEECRHSRSQPWEEEWAFCTIEASWEEVRCFDRYDYIRFLIIS